MSQIGNDIQALLAPAVEALGLELLGLEFRPGNGNALLRLYIDAPSREGGVTLDDCEAVSREVSALMDVHDPIDSHYTLEVSSPGIDRPLFKPAHFARFVGESAKIALEFPQDGRKRFSSFNASTQEQYKTCINNYIKTILPVWMQYRNTYINF